jgi:hypothetical protein
MYTLFLVEPNDFDISTEAKIDILSKDKNELIFFMI